MDILETPKDIAQDRIPCFNHQNQIGLNGTAVAVYGIQYVYDVFRSCAFLNTGTHLLRLACSAMYWADKVLGLRQGAPSDVEQQFMDTMIDYYET